MEQEYFLDGRWVKGDDLISVFPEAFKALQIARDPQVKAAIAKSISDVLSTCPTRFLVPLNELPESEMLNISTN